MHHYDSVLKDLLRSPQNSILERITGSRIDYWLNVEFPEVQQTRVDLLGETADHSRLIALELQSFNDPMLPLRMAEYALRIYRLHGRFPDQYVLYVGNAELKMPEELAGANFSCRYKVFDIRMLDEETLLNSPFDADNIMAILAAHRDRRESIRRILARIATLEGSSLDNAFKKLTILAGLRELDDSIRSEAKYMPILNDIMDHGIIGPAIREGLEKGRQEGREEGLEKGLQQGEMRIIRELIEQRFGVLPTWADDRLTKLSAQELLQFSRRLLEAGSIEELFNR